MLGDISPVIALMKGELMLPDSLAAHAKCYTNVAAGETESRGLFAAPSTALHILVVYGVARCASAHGVLRDLKDINWLS